VSLRYKKEVKENEEQGPKEFPKKQWV